MRTETTQKRKTDKNPKRRKKHRKRKKRKPKRNQASERLSDASCRVLAVCARPPSSRYRSRPHGGCWLSQNTRNEAAVPCLPALLSDDTGRLVLGIEAEEFSRHLRPKRLLYSTATHVGMPRRPPMFHPGGWYGCVKNTLLSPTANNNSQQPAANSQRPAASSQQPAPTANSQQPTASTHSQQPTATIPADGKAFLDGCGPG